MRTLTFALLGALMGSTVHANLDTEPSIFHKECDKTKDTDTEIQMLFNVYPTQWGLYEVVGCEGVAPTLRISAGKEYKFSQGDRTNWYHPIGFSYIAGGAHTECKQADGSYGECPELGGEEPTSYIQYYVNGVPGDDGEFGLDAYEPEFFNSLEWWMQRETYFVTLQIPADACFTRIYYFCHIHAHASAEIEIEGSTCPTDEQTILNKDALGGETQRSALAIYQEILLSERPHRDEFDVECGTSDSSGYTDENPLCADKHYLCGPGADSVYGTCLQAVDCQMHEQMAVKVLEDISLFTTFAQQMIPHHQNAVAMSKILDKHMTPHDFPTWEQEGADGPDEAEYGYEFASYLNQEIIAVQNYQIQQLQGWLKTGVKDWPDLIGQPSNRHGYSGYCYEEYPLNPKCHGIGENCPKDTECFCRVGTGMMASRRKLLFGTAPTSDDCYCMYEPHLG